ncbi:MAG: histidine phosphatase family protein [Bacteroidetes bacterium]|nr:histidine phosphatase family protein [Bacteroidota bacterium]
MKRQLILIRHTKSNWDNPLDSDFDRPINKDRVNDTLRMSKKLKDLGLKPDLILCSPANRTRQTAEYFCKALNFETENVLFDKRLYESPAEEYLEVVQETEADIKTLVVVGHNPSTTHFANLFLDEKVLQVPTTGVVWIEFNHPDWHLSPPSVKGHLKYFLTPKAL